MMSFRQDLFPDTPKSDLSIQQSKVIHKNVVRKKGRVRKRQDLNSYLIRDYRKRHSKSLVKK